MTVLSLDRIARPRHTAARQARTRLADLSMLIGESIHAARELDNVVSPGAQLTVLKRFAARIDQ